MSYPPLKLKPLEIDRQLAADGDGSYRERLCAQLNHHAAELRRLMTMGLGADDFAQADKLNDAMAAAVSVVRSRWQSFRS